MATETTRNKVLDTAAFFVLMVSSVLMVFTDNNTQYLTPIRGGLENAIVPFELIVETPVSWVTDIGEYFQDREILLTRIEQQEQQLEELMSLAVQYGHLQKRYETLAESSSQNTSTAYQMQLVEIVRVVADPQRREVVINRGSRDGIEEGMIVVDNGGIYGKITSVLPQSSIVLTLQDQRLAIPVRNSRNGLRAVASSGGSRDQVFLEYVGSTADIQVGDLMLTSGLGGAYPPDFLVGEVTSVDRDDDGARMLVEIEPTASVETAVFLYAILGPVS